MDYSKRLLKIKPYYIKMKFCEKWNADMNGKRKKITCLILEEKNFPAFFNSLMVGIKLTWCRFHWLPFKKLQYNSIKMLILTKFKLLNLPCHQ